MAEIFVSHSKSDVDLKNFFATVFSTTKVKAIWEEYEKIINPELITSEKIKNDIKRSNAIFIILSQNVQNLLHSRDWILWESGVGTINNKDIWVFEPFEQLGRISTIVPNLKHYVLFEINEPWFDYIYRIITSYDDSNILLTTTLKLNEIITLGGLINPVNDKLNDRSYGLPIRCISCSSVYNIHFPANAKENNRFNFRCPVCNKILSIPCVN